MKIDKKALSLMRKPKQAPVKKSQSDGMLSDGTDAGFWLDWISQEEIDSLPGERKKPEVI